MKSIVLSINVLFLIELVLGGPGYWSISSTISVRKALFVFSLVSLFLYVTLLKGWRLYFRDYIIMFFISSSMLVWTLFIPALKGGSLNFAFQDSSAVLLLLLYFPLAQLVRRHAINWEKLKNIFVNLVFIVAVSQVGLWMIVYLYPDLGGAIRIATSIFFSGGNTDDSIPIYVGGMSDGFYRVMWISSLFILPAFFIDLSVPRKSVTNYLRLFIFTAALYVSYTRAMWIGLIIGLSILAFRKLLIFLSFMSKGNILIRRAFPLFLVLLSIICIIAVKYESLRESNMINRITSMYSNDDDSISVRTQQIDSLLESWMEQPVMGAGFGGHAEVIRSDDAPYSYEATGAALLMKLGIIGSLLWIGTAVIFLRLVYMIAKRRRNRHWLYYWLSSTCAFFVSSMTNPYLMNFIGFSILLFLLLEIDYNAAKWSL